ncbi:MAG: dihydrofolate reductase [Sphingobacteriaceae bacterium]
MSTDSTPPIAEGNHQTVNIIVAASDNDAIGKNNQLLWHLPADLKYFKMLTTGHPVLMGRKTYESIGKPLPNRRNIVITRQPIQITGCEVASSIDTAIDLCGKEKEIFIIGGAEIFRQVLSRTDRIYFTRVHRHFEGDTYFPTLEKTVWKEISRIDHDPDEKNLLPYSFLTLKRC